jgi:hypothetical protein
MERERETEREGKRVREAKKRQIRQNFEPHFMHLL